MQTFDKDILYNYLPSTATWEKALFVMEKIGKLNTRLKDVFSNFRQPSRIFAFVESKYSSKIEGIYTTLFDVVNTGIETNQQKIIKPIVDELLKSKEPITYKKMIGLALAINSDKDQANRFKPEFGVYHLINKQNIKIYEPIKDKKEINSLLKMLLTKAENDKNIIEILHTHILFEKIHPFVDANGRLGRLLMQKSLAKTMNFTSILPLS
jgi:Fic family protein